MTRFMALLLTSEEYYVASSLRRIVHLIRTKTASKMGKSLGYDF